MGELETHGVAALTGGQSKADTLARRKHGSCCTLYGAVGFVLRHGTLVVRIPNGRSIIGRADGCLVRVDEVQVSRRHAELELSSGGLHIEELNRKTGVMVNGRRIEGRHRLENGDRIGIGGAEIVVEAQLPKLEVRLPRLEDALDEMREDDAITESTTVAGHGLAVHRKTVTELLESGDVQSAAEILSGDMTAIFLLFNRGKRVSSEDLEETAACAVQLAARSGQARWLDNILRIYARARAPIPAPLLDSMHAAAQASTPLAAETVGAYLDVVRELPQAGDLVSRVEKLGAFVR